MLATAAISSGVYRRTGFSWGESERKTIRTLLPDYYAGYSAVVPIRHAPYVGHPPSTDLACMKPSTRHLAVLATVVTVAACTAENAHPGTSEAEGVLPSTSAMTLAVATEQGVRNARMPIEGLITAGQPNQEQLEALRSAGVEHFVSLRPTSEDGAGWEEALSANEGFAFDRLPITGAGALTRENVETFAAIMQEVDGASAVLYCASSNRVGAMLALKAHWIDGEPPEAALELGLSAGLTSLETPVRELLGLEPNRP